MTTTEKRKHVTDFVKKEADEKLVNMIYALVQEYTNETYVRYELTDEQFQELEKERKLYKSGKAKTYSLEEVNNLLTGKTK